MPDALSVDWVDAAILDLFTTHPRIGVLEASRRLHLARGTVQSRLDKLIARGVVTGWGPHLDPAALGFPVTAFVTVEVRKGSQAAVAARCEAVPEVLEVHVVTGPGDLLCRVVARSNADLHRVLDRLASSDDVLRTTTVVALGTPVEPRVLPLVQEAAQAPHEVSDPVDTDHAVER